MPILDERSIRALFAQEHEGDGENEQQGEGSCEDKAFKRILRIVSVRDRAISDIKKRLLKESLPEDAVESAIARACRCGLVDDARFAESLIRSRLASGSGRQGIEAELAHLEIDASQIPGWPDELFPTESEELERALGLLERKPPTAKNKRDAAYRKLVGKGYGSQTASTAVRLWYESLD